MKPRKFPAPGLLHSLELPGASALVGGPPVATLGHLPLVKLDAQRSSMVRHSKRSAILTSSDTDFAPNFRTALARCTLTVTSLSPKRGPGPSPRHAGGAARLLGRHQPLAGRRQAAPKDRPRAATLASRRRPQAARRKHPAKNGHAGGQDCPETVGFSLREKQTAFPGAETTAHGRRSASRGARCLPLYAPVTPWSSPAQYREPSARARCG